MDTIVMYTISMPAHRPTPGSLVWRLSMRWRAAVDAAVAPLGLTHAQYVVLATLAGITRAGGPPSQRELADRTGLDPIYISRLVRALARAGLLIRADDARDARRVRLTVTRKGRRVIDRAIRIVGDLQERLTAALGGTSGPAMRRLMQDLDTLIAAATPAPRSRSSDRRHHDRSANAHP